MATQIIATLGVAIFIGYRFDRWMGWRFPVGIIVLALASLFSIFRKVYYDTLKKNSK